MKTIVLSGGDFGGQTAEVEQAGDEVRIERGLHVLVYEAREVEDHDSVTLVGVFVRSERKQA